MLSPKVGKALQFYEIFRGFVEIEGKEHPAYGIVMYNQNPIYQQGRFAVDNISDDETFVTELVEYLGKEDLDPISLNEVVLDYINEKMGVWFL